jgi:putative N6-adenine-specific DNA methylase
MRLEGEGSILTARERGDSPRGQVDMRILVTVSKALEEVVAAELAALGLRGDAAPGVVSLDGSLADAMRANLELRAARRVLLELARFPATSAEDLYEGARGVDWSAFLTTKGTFAVEASVRDAFTGHSGFVALKVKDAVADWFRDRFGERPDVDRDDPDLGVVVHLRGSECTLCADSSGGPLHKRGYRKRTVPGALNETLAAGIVLLSGYTGAEPFCDPMCGSGTLLIEAALIATRTAPGLLRPDDFGFQRWPDYGRKAWEEMVQESLSRVAAPPSPIVGADKNGVCVKVTETNLDAAGMGKCVRVRRREVHEFVPPPGPGVIATNPPYGDHVGAGEDLVPLYRSLGDMLKRSAPGYRAFVLCGNPALGKQVGLRPAQRRIVYNGPSECRLLRFDLYSGSLKKSHFQEETDP